MKDKKTKQELALEKVRRERINEELADDGMNDFADDEKPLEWDGNGDEPPEVWQQMIDTAYGDFKQSLRPRRRYDPKKAEEFMKERQLSTEENHDI